MMHLFTLFLGSLADLKTKDSELNGSRRSSNATCSNFFMNEIFICYYHFHILKLCQIFVYLQVLAVFSFLCGNLWTNLLTGILYSFYVSLSLKY
jgi:hypothetical protein